MHIVLRSTLARGSWSFRRHVPRVAGFLQGFADKYQVVVLGYAIVSNHIHLHSKFPSVSAYHRYIRAVFGAIARAVAGRLKRRFWELRPYSRVVIGEQRKQVLVRYVRVNQLEALGFTREQARLQVAREFPTCRE